MTARQSPDRKGGKHSQAPSAAIYHIALRAEWEAARQAGQYRFSTRGQTLEQAGFIHASTADQVEGTRHRFYQGAGDLVLLKIDPTLLRAEVRYEDGYPHIYGPLNLDSVVSVTPMEARVS